MSNDNWKETQQTEIEATGLQPQDEVESAILMTLSPGPWTATVAGKDGPTGVGQVEVFPRDDAGAPGSRTSRLRSTRRGERWTAEKEPF